MAAAAERFAPPSGANRSSAWSESPHPPPCLKRRERPVASMKNNVSGRETRFFVFLEKNRRDWHDTCMSFFQRRESLHDDQGCQPASGRVVRRSADRLEAVRSTWKETTREPCPCGRAIPIGRCVLGTHAGRCPAVCTPHRLVFVDRVVGVTSPPHLIHFESPPKKETFNDLPPVVVRFSYSPRHVFAARELRDGCDRGDRGRGRLTPLAIVQHKHINHKGSRSWNSTRQSVGCGRSASTRS